MISKDPEYIESLKLHRNVDANLSGSNLNFTEKSGFVKNQEYFSIFVKNLINFLQILNRFTFLLTHFQQGN